LRLLLSDFQEGHKEVSAELSPESLDLKEFLHAVGPVSVELDIERRGDQLTIRGIAHVLLTGECARCAKPVEKALNGEILTFADRRGRDEPQDEAALEQDGSILYHDGLELSLREAIRETVLLEVPIQVLCQDECKGLCPRCGVDLNEETCDCSSLGVDSRWESLRKLNPSDS